MLEGGGFILNTVKQEPKIITIEALNNTADKIPVAAYCRVSTDSDDQMNSFEAQNHYFTALIANNADWQLVDIYADPGISGLSTDKRDDFNRMMNDCRRGKIKKILVKSISRFARNTTDCLSAIRELRFLGVSVYFEKENIDTANQKGEFMTALFATFAQSESESISKNIRWSCQKRMQSGSFVPSKAPYGFRLVNRKFVIYEPEAEIVRDIFNRYINGESDKDIAEHLNKNRIPSPSGNEKWGRTSVSVIISNERYTGDALLQKTYTTDTVPFKVKKKHGERDQYYMTNANPPIISREIFKAAKELRRLRTNRPPNSEVRNKFLTGKIICAHCGTIFRRVSGDIIYWKCRNRDINREECPTFPVPESEIHNAFMRLHYKLKRNTQILEQMLENLLKLRECKMFKDEEIIELNSRITNLQGQNQMLTELKAQGLVDPDVYISQQCKLTEEIREMKLRKEQLLIGDGDKIIDYTRDLIEILNASPDEIAEFSGELFNAIVDKIIVESSTRVKFKLINGAEFTETIERAVRI